MSDIINDIEQGIDLTQKSINIIDKLLAPIISHKEEARQYAIEVFKRDKSLSEAEKQTVAFILNSKRYINNINSILKKAAPMVAEKDIRNDYNLFK